MAIFEDTENNIFIRAENIDIDPSVILGTNINITINGDIKVGKYSNLGSNLSIKANDVIIGEHFYHSSGLKIGGGGADGPCSNIKFGDRCVVHNNFLNVCCDIELGNDVGLSPEVAFITHGFWQSVLEGYPRKFESIKIGNGVIIGYRSIVLPGVEISDDCVIGAHSNVVKSLNNKGIYGGNPAKFLAVIKEKSIDEQNQTLIELLEEYRILGKFHNVSGLESLTLDFPYISFKGIKINALEQVYHGLEDEDTDDFRDFLRRCGIRLYSPRGFKSKKHK